MMRQVYINLKAWMWLFGMSEGHMQREHIKAFSFSSEGIYDRYFSCARD